MSHETCDEEHMKLALGATSSDEAIYIVLRCQQPKWHLGPHAAVWTSGLLTWQVEGRIRSAAL